MSDNRELTEAMRRFSEERDWTRFHDPKSLTLALVGEVGELAELLQWLPVEEIDVLVREPLLRDRLAEELADVLPYLLRLSDVLGVDISAEAVKKLNSNRPAPRPTITEVSHPSGIDSSRNMEMPPSGGSEPRPNRLPLRTCLHPGDHG